MKLILCLVLLLAVLSVSTGHRGYRYGRYRSMQRDSREDSHGDSYESRHHDSRYDDSRRDSSRHDSSSSSESRHQESREHRDGEHYEAEHHDDHHVYRFHVGQNYGAYEYTDEDARAQGFNIDLLRTVCQHAQKRCYFTVDRHTHCWVTDDSGHEYPGIGLLAGWYDGCLGFFPSPERKNSFNFSVPFTKNLKAGVYYKSSVLKQDGVHDLTGQKIGFLDGWATNQQCLERQKDFQGNQPGQYKAIMFESLTKLHEGIVAGVVDAAMTIDAFEGDNFGVQHAEPLFECTDAGLALMARYGDPVIDWWNAAFQEVVDSGDYRLLCDAAITRHGERGEVQCLE